MLLSLKPSVKIFFSLSYKSDLYYQYCSLARQERLREAVWNYQNFNYHFKFKLRIFFYDFHQYFCRSTFLFFKFLRWQINFNSICCFTLLSIFNYCSLQKIPKNKSFLKLSTVSIFQFILHYLFWQDFQLFAAIQFLI